jgi:hypothetical protein
MLSLLKRKSEAADAPSVPAWHPNFRNYERLPDIKVVRTAFFINGAAIAIVVAIATYLGFNEWQLHVIRTQIAEAEQQIARDKRASDQAVALFKRFQAEESKINEVEAFVKAKPLVSPVLMRLAETLPANVALDNIDFRESGMVMRLSIRGTPDAASGYATSYLEQLRSDKQLSLFDEFMFTSTPTPNPSTGRMAVEFFLHLKGAPPGKR